MLLLAFAVLHILCFLFSYRISYPLHTFPHSSFPYFLISVFSWFLVLSLFKIDQVFLAHLLSDLKKVNWNTEVAYSSVQEGHRLFPILSRHIPTLSRTNALNKSLNLLPAFVTQLEESQLEQRSGLFVIMRGLQMCLID